MKIVIEDVIGTKDVSVEDGGRAKYVSLGCDALGLDQDGVFVRLHSWIEKADRFGEMNHKQFDAFIGKKVRVTVEVIDEKE